MRSNKKVWQYVLFALFALSGFSGLIYESIWSHYLKLFLGHAAYAQTLVLGLFMGGMAIGAWLSGRVMKRMSNPLLGYVTVEVVIGLFGLFFHNIFQFITGFMLDSILPGMESAFLSELVRWVMAALLILPQTLLLGATFPLMSVGILRAYPLLPGSSIALLYFTNSIGAVLGVLASGFLLIGWVGLPGTILTASLANFILALSVYLVAKRIIPNTEQDNNVSDKVPNILRPLLFVALFTGLSSFVYEIGWIRMLVMVLGASTHAFELMLSAFILGIALGGFWVKRRIDGFANTEYALGIIQILMGFAALGTVLFYNQLFDVMQGIMSALQRNDAGYFFFNLSSHFIAAMVMLPTTFLAGMTLPLITYILFKHGGGESSIGKVYAFNTIGAILGVWLSVQVLMPYFGLKATIMAGVVIDLALGFYLLRRSGVKLGVQSVVIAASLLVVICTSVFVTFDPNRMISGVFRHGQGLIKDAKHVFHKDGKTATIDVFDTQDGLVRTISTNGKPDASVTTRGNPSADHPTMVLTGGLPLLFKPDAKTAAVIGMGSGISANVLLSSPFLKSLDIVEIEGAMVEGARFFGRHSSRVFEDPRSHIIIDDAKSFFASHRKHYDLIISEPSNPWVSGVSSLFTEEFYSRIKHYLNEDGLLVQWFQLYETNPAVVSSIVTALSRNFEDYAIYASVDSDLILVAKPKGNLPALSAKLFGEDLFKKDFEEVKWFSLADVEAHKIGSKAVLDALFLQLGVPVNSDFFPYVDQSAVAARFKRENAVFLLDTKDSLVPFWDATTNKYPEVSLNTRPIAFTEREKVIQSRLIAQYYVDGDLNQNLTEQSQDLMISVNSPFDCSNEKGWMKRRGQLINLLALVLPRVDVETSVLMMKKLLHYKCDSGVAYLSEWINLFNAVAKRDLVAQKQLAENILENDSSVNDIAIAYVLESAMMANYGLGEYENVIQLSTLTDRPTITMDLLRANAVMQLAAIRK